MWRIGTHNQVLWVAHSSVAKHWSWELFGMEEAAESVTF